MCTFVQIRLLKHHMPTDIEDKLMGPIFSNQKTGAALLGFNPESSPDVDDGDFSVSADSCVDAVCTEPSMHDTVSVLNEQLAAKCYL